MISTRLLTVTTALAFALPAAAAAQTGVVALSTEPDDSQSVLQRAARLSVAELPLAEALNTLHATSGVPVSFSSNFLPPGRRVSCACISETVGGALDRLLAGTELEYQDIEGHILIRPALARYPRETIPLRASGARLASMPLVGTDAAFLQPVRLLQESFVSGTVLDARRRQPLTGAQVVVEATDQGTLTDNRGRFRIEGLSGNEVTLQVVMLGYESVSRTVPVGTQDVELGLTETAIALDEVVVTGTAAGAAQRRSIGNSVSRIDAAEVTQLAPIRGVDQLLNARAPGVVVTSGDGWAGAGARIQIRGRSSLTLNPDPIVYVDGVRVNSAAGTGVGDAAVISRLNDFSPSDIESIEVIKGPAAATLYGTEAANGVIQIITKKGRSGETKIGVRVEQGASWFANAEDRWSTTWWRDPDNGELVSLNIVQSERERGTPLWRTGHIQRYGVDVSGGNETVRFFASADYNKEQGYELSNVAELMGARLNISATPSATFDLQANMGVVLNEVTATDDAIVWDGYSSTPSTLGTDRRGWRRRTPEAARFAFNNDQETRRFTGSVELNHRPTGWLAQKFTLGIDHTDQEDINLTPRLPAQFAGIFDAETASGFKALTNSKISFVSLDYGATVALPVTQNLTTNTSVGTQYNRQATNMYELEGIQFPAGGLETISAATERTGGEDAIENVTVGVYLQEQLAWKDRIFLTGAVRADDNSAFGESFDLVTYPKVSASWVLSEEPFWNMDWMDVFRLRGAFGASGQQPDAFAAIRRFRPVPGPGGTIAVAPEAIGNPDLKPERGEELELGFEFALLNQRLGVDLTYYNQRTRDMILLQDVPPSVGFGGTEQFINIGEVSNSGFEVLVSGVPLQRDRMSWDLSLNLSTNDNEIVSLGAGIDEIVAEDYAGTLHRVGFAPASFFVKQVVSADVDEDGTLLSAMCNAGSGNAPVPCDEAPRIYWGRQTPSVQASLSSTFTYGNWRLSGLADFRGGHKKFNTHYWYNCTLINVCRENYVPGEFEDTYIAEIQLAGNEQYSYYFEDGDFLTLREISLSYALPESWAGRFGASRANVMLSARNLATWTAYTGMDPEVTWPAQWALNGDWGGRLPLPAQFITRVDLEF